MQAIVVPNTEAFVSEGLEKMGGVDIARVEAILRTEVKDRCQNLAPFKRVTRLTVRHEEFEKTTTKKIKRYLYTGKARVSLRPSAESIADFGLRIEFGGDRARRTDIRSTPAGVRVRQRGRRSNSD